MKLIEKINVNGDVNFEGVLAIIDTDKNGRLLLVNGRFGDFDGTGIISLRHLDTFHGAFMGLWSFDKAYQGNDLSRRKLGFNDLSFELITELWGLV